MTQKLTFTAPCSIQAEAGGGLEKGTIVMQPAYSGGVLHLGGWDHPCVVDVATIRAAAPLIPCRVGHGQLETDVLGQIAVSIDSGNVNALGRVTNRESEGPRAVLSMASAGHQFQASIGGEPARKDFIPPGQTIDMNGRTFSGPIYACYDTTLGEISVVSLGADTTTSTTIAAKGKPVMADEKKPDFSEFCKAAGFDPGTMDDKQKASMANMHAKMTAGDGDPPPEKKDDDKKKDEEKKAEAARAAASIQAAHATPSASTIMAERAQAYERIAQVEAACKDHADLCASALKGNWDDQRIENEIELKVLRTDAPRTAAPPSTWPAAASTWARPSKPPGCLPATSTRIAWPRSTATRTCPGPAAACGAWASVPCSRTPPGCRASSCRNTTALGRNTSIRFSPSGTVRTRSRSKPTAVPAPSACRAF